jgi:hypothetical protein
VEGTLTPEIEAITPDRAAGIIWNLSFCILQVLGIKFRALYMLGKCSTTKLYPQLCLEPLNKTLVKKNI